MLMNTGIGSSFTYRGSLGPQASFLAFSVLDDYWAEINNYGTEPSHFLSYEMWKRADSHKGTAISSAVTRAQNTPGTQHFYHGILTYLAAPCLSQKHPEPGPGSNVPLCLPLVIWTCRFSWPFKRINQKTVCFCPLIGLVLFVELGFPGTSERDLI